MNMLSKTLTPLFPFSMALAAADLPPVPGEPIAARKELLFPDDFEAAEPAKVWHKVQD